MTMIKDDRLLNVDEEVRRLMREFGDMCFDQVEQEEIDAKHREYMAVKNLQMKGMRYVPRF
jgi:hypothetical protein